MKKLLIASTALSLAGGAAFAEMAITVSGDAELGVDYASEPGEGMSKHSFVHEVGIDFSGSGTTDGGLTFGGSAGFDTGDDVVNTGTVHVSGSFGTLTIGDNDAADLTAGGIADIGMNGIGVDDMVEGLRGNSAAALRYDNSFGQISIAISAGTKDGEETSSAVEAVTQMDGTYFYTLQGGTSIVGDVFKAASPEMGPGLDLDDADFNAAFTAATAAAVAADDEFDSYSPPAVGSKLNDDGVPGTADGTALEGDALKSYQIYVMHHNLNGGSAVGGDDDEADTSKPAVSTIVEAVDEVEAMPAVIGKSKTQYAFGMSFEAGGVTIGVGYDSDKTVSMGAGFTTGEITTNLLYVKTDDDEDTKNMDESKTGMGVDMAYSMGASTVTLAYGRMKPKEDGMEAMDAVGMGVTHDLGGGATMNAGFGKVDKMVGTEMVSENKASIGLMFAF